MKRTLVLLLGIVTPLSLLCQPEEVNETLHKAHVKCSHEYNFVQGKKQLVRQYCYDTAGRTISWLVVNHFDKKTVVSSDTVIFHSPAFYSSIPGQKNSVYDSIQYRISSGNGMDTLTENTWYKGQIVLHTVYVHDDKPRLTVYSDPTDKSHMTTYHSYAYKTDSLNRLVAQDEKTVNDDGKKKEVHIAYGFTVHYTDSLIVYEHYTEQYDGRKSHFLSFGDYRGRMDSSVFYTDKGDIDYTFAIYKNIAGKDSLSRQRDKHGNVTHLNNTRYADNMEYTTHRDSTGEVWKTEENRYNEKGLLISHTENDLSTGITSVTVFEYEYY